MKKVLIAGILLFSTANSFAQLTVDSLGSVIIGDECMASTKLKIGETSALPYLTSKANINSTLKTYTPGFNVSVYGEAYSITNNSQRVAAGVCGVAGNGMNGKNYGTAGILYGNYDGAGIYGDAVGSSGFTADLVPGKYAGYFKGNIYVKGIANLRGYEFISNSMLSESVHPLGETIGNGQVLPEVMKIETYEYKDSPLIENYNEGEEDRLHFGISAEKLIYVYPNLVKKVDNGDLFINYNELIPILIKSIQELKQEINELKEKYESK